MVGISSEELNERRVKAKKFFDQFEACVDTISRHPTEDMREMALEAIRNLNETMIKYHLSAKEVGLVDSLVDPKQLEEWLDEEWEKGIKLVRYKQRLKIAKAMGMFDEPGDIEGNNQKEVKEQ